MECACVDFNVRVNGRVEYCQDCVIASSNLLLLALPCAPCFLPKDFRCFWPKDFPCFPSRALVMFPFVPASVIGSW